MSTEDLNAVRETVREWANAENRLGPKSIDLPDIVEMLVATGMRIGELLALRWSDIELAAAPKRRNDGTWFPWLMVNGKIDAAIRPISLLNWAVALLVAQTPNDLNAAFVSRNGTWHYPVNIQGRLRRIRLLDENADLTALECVTPHSFRRTVATEIDEVYDAEAAKNQLGHTSTTVTERHSINRKLVVPDYREATERLAPRPEQRDGPAPGH